MVSLDQAPQAPFPPTFPQQLHSANNNAPPPPGYDSPYRDLMQEAHHTAHVSNTPHGKYKSKTQKCKYP